MIAAATTSMIDQPAARRWTVTPAVEVLVLALAVSVAVGSYWTLTGFDAPQRLIAPPLVALLLVANLLPAVALLVLLGRSLVTLSAWNQ